MSTVEASVFRNPSSLVDQIVLEADGTFGGELASELGSKLDTSAYTEPGMVLITSESFSAVSSVSVNGCFTSTHANYSIVLSNLIASGNVGLQMRLRVSASDDSTSNYFWSYDGTRSNNTSFTTAGASSTAWTVSATRTVAFGGATIQVFTPQETEVTSVTSEANAGESSHYNQLSMGGVFAATTAFDGFSVFPQSGTFSGKLRVYGYRN